MIFRLTSALVLACVAGCATSGKFEANMNSLMHEAGSEERLVSWLGVPQGVYQLDENTKILTFQHSGQVVMPGQTYTTPVTSRTTGYVGTTPYSANTTTYAQSQGAPTVIGLNCTITATVRYGMLIEWRANGNHCVSR